MPEKPSILMKSGDRLLDIGLAEDGTLLLLWSENKVAELRASMPPEELFKFHAVLDAGLCIFMERLLGGVQ